MHFTGIIIAVSTFLIIGIFHPIVIKVEYHWGTRPWWIFLLLGIISIASALFIEKVILSALLGVIGASLLWSIGELFEQRKRVMKGWFPMNPKRRDQYKNSTMGDQIKTLIIIALAIMTLSSCGDSYEETKRQTRAERMRLAKEDSAAFKVAVMPTLDCLPLWVAKNCGMFDSLGVDIRLKWFTAQMDCDTALANKRVEASVTDLVRAQWLIDHGTALEMPIATNAYWILVSNKNSRIKDLKQLDDKMIAMTRHSATDMLADHAIDSAKLKTERVFKVQINDVNVRMQMLRNNVMDALLLTEPHATAALMEKHKAIMDSRKLDLKLGVFALRKSVTTDKTRKKQIEAFMKGYNMAVDSINKNGIASYSDLITKYCKVSTAAVDSIAKSGMKFSHAQAPRDKDIERAKKYIAK